MIIAFTSVTSQGATFMDWSFHWLLGEKKFWNINKGWIDVVDNPLREIDAHHHKKNHPNEIEKIYSFLKKAKEIEKECNKIITFYPCLNNFILKNSKINIVKDKFNLYYERYEEMIKVLASNGIKIILIKKLLPYPYLLERVPNSSYSEQTTNQFTEQFMNSVWFYDKIKFNSLKKTREYASHLLVKRTKQEIKKNETYYKTFELLPDLFSVSDKEWYKNQLKVMKEIFKFLKLKIDKDRLNHWETICNKWHSMHKKTLTDFYEKDIFKITEAIINNKRIDLGKYNLNLLKEITIMSHLFDRYGKRLLLTTDDFPLDTQKLHTYLKD